MSPLGALLVGGGVAGLVDGRRRTLIVSAVVVSWLQPLLGACLVGAGSLIVWRNRLRRRRAAHEAAQTDVTLLGELVALSLTAGLSLHASLVTAQQHIGSELAGELERVLRGARHAGLAGVLSEANGTGERLYRVTARAVTTGAPLAAAVDSFVHEQLSEERARRLAEAGRLPVRLMVPLALLILPGFVLMTLAPALASTLDRLELPI